MAAAACKPAIHMMASPRNLCTSPQSASFPAEELAIHGNVSTRKPPGSVSGCASLPSDSCQAMSLRVAGSMPSCGYLIDRRIQPELAIQIIAFFTHSIRADDQNSELIHSELCCSAHIAA